MRTAFGRLGEEDVFQFTLTNAHGLVLGVTNYGATVTSLRVPDRHGRLDDVVLGFDSLDGYVRHTAYFGATIGRVANRIAGATFTLDGARFSLAANDGAHHLHGGRAGWDRRIWDAAPVATDEGPALVLSRVSPAGEEGYPGTVEARVTYTLTHADELSILFEASADAPTPLTMAHHGYWNLGGHASGSALGHVLTLAARDYTPGAPQIPDGHVAPAAGTPLDFTTRKPLGRDLMQVQVAGAPIGYDHNFVVDGTPGQLREVARLEEPVTGRVLTLRSDQAGVQLYTGNYLDGTLRGKGGVRYDQYAGVCLETQAFPNAINVPAWAPGVVLRPGEIYRHRMLFGFGVV